MTEDRTESPVEAVGVTFPSDREWGVADDLHDRWDTERLAEGLDELGHLGTASVVVLECGHLVAERHWGPAGRRQLDDVASVQKSLIAVLVGVAVDRGLLRTDDPVVDHLGTGWSRAGDEHERDVTVHDLLSMTSGLSPTLESVAPAGTTWTYNTLAYQMLKPLLVAVSGLPLDVLTRQWLTHRIGMDDTSWVPRQPVELPSSTPDAVLQGMRSQGFVQDPDGRWAHRMPDGSMVTGLASTAGDLARLGLLVAARGTWMSEPVVSGDWLARATAPSQRHNDAYGYLFWLGGRRGTNAFGQPFDRFEPSAPGDLVAARGANQQLVDLSPSLGLVLARTAMPGAAPLGASGVAVATRLWEVVMEARR